MEITIEVLFKHVITLEELLLEYTPFREDGNRGLGQYGDKIHVVPVEDNILAWNIREK